MIDDESLPVIEIVADSGDVAENAGIAKFNLTTTDLSVTTTININATPAEDGSDFLTDAIADTAADFSVEFSDPDGDGTYNGKLSVNLDDDMNGEVTGDIKLTLNPDPDPVATYQLGSEVEGVITIFDDETPELKITAGDQVAEAEEATADFVITAGASPNRNITVLYDLAESQNFIDNEGTDLTETLNFTNGATTDTLSIAIAEDSNPEDNGTITVTIKPDNADPITYLVATDPNNSAVVNVVDDDTLPLILIAENNGEVVESVGTATFELTATGLNATTTLDINATPAEDGSDFLSDSVADTAADFPVEFTDPDGDNTYTGELRVTLDDDNVGESTGNIKITLNTKPATYRLGSNTESVIRIWDNETPALKVTAGEPVAEAMGATADFIVSAEVSPNKLVTIQYELSESEDFIANEGDDKSEELDFRNNVKQDTLSIPITSDSDPEASGFVTVILTADTENPIVYTVAPSPFDTANVNVIDDDALPVLEIAADSGDIAENASNPSFTLMATGLIATTTLTINATPAEDGSDFLTDAVADTMSSVPVQFDDPDGDGIYTGEFPIALDNDTVGEATGDIKLTLNANPTAYRLGTTLEGVLTVWDDDAPELKITAGLPVTETDNVKANFIVSVEVSPNRSVTVRYDLTESHNFIDSEGTGKFEILDYNNNDTEATISLAIINDQDEEPNGTITVTLTPDTADPITYTLPASSTNSAEVIVYDEDSPPTIAIAADSGQVVENDTSAQDQHSMENARFKVSATGLIQTTTLNIDATPAEDGHDFLTDQVANTMLSRDVELTDPDKDSTFEGELLVPIDNDIVGEATGDFKLTLNAKSTVYRLGARTEGKITVLDDDAPELRIIAGDPVAEAEGAVANFIISAEVSPNEEVEIRYNLAESHNFIDSEGTNLPKRLNFAGGATEAILPIPINNDGTVEDNGTITVTLVPDQAPLTYTLDPDLTNSATVNVVDDDSLPLIAIAPLNGEVAESVGTAQFAVTATGLNATTTIAINATPTEEGFDFLTNAVANSAADFTVELSDPDGDNTYSGQISIALDNDNIGEATGLIKLTLNASPFAYRLGEITEGRITIFDDDAPELRITPGDPVAEAEGAVANFVVRAEVTPNEIVTIHYDLEESQNFIDNEGTGKMTDLDFSNEVVEVILPIPLTNDSMVEDDGTITVTLTADSNPIEYTVAPDPNHTAVVSIVDDDSLPVISIVADSGEVVESENIAGFMLTATRFTATTTLDINATPAEDGHDFLTEQVAGIGKNFSVEFSDPDGDDTYTGELLVDLHNDDIGEPTGDIKVTLNANPTTYNLGTTTEGVITIWDDDAPELKIMAGTPITETANVTADFMVSAEVSPNKIVPVIYELAESSDFLDEGPDKMANLNFTNQATEATLSVPINNDDVAEDNGTITVTLTADTATEIKYTVAPSPDNSATMTIYDDDSPPTISIAATVVKSPKALEPLNLIYLQQD